LTWSAQVTAGPFRGGSRQGARTGPVAGSAAGAAGSDRCPPVAGAGRL